MEEAAIDNPASLIYYKADGDPLQEIWDGGKKHFLCGCPGDTKANVKPTTGEIESVNGSEGEEAKECSE